ncbi:maleate cis-trans isomerase family protein [Streptomyces olivoreticuli]
MPATETPSLPRVGLLIPSSNTVMERDLRSSLEDVADLYSARMHLVETTEGAEAAMLDTYLPQTIEDIASLRPAVTVFGCTSAGALRGPDYDRDLCARIADRTRSRAVSTIASVSAAISGTGRHRVAVLTPYVDELNVKIRSSLISGGLEILAIEGFGIEDSFRLAEPTPREIADRALTLIGRVRPEALFISCTNFRALEAVDEIESAAGIPVVTSNSAVAAAVREALSEAR